MVYKLPEEQTKKLQMLPETSMGSQHVDIYFSNGLVLRNIAVFNCSIFESDKDVELNLIKKIEINNGL